MAEATAAGDDEATAVVSLVASESGESAGTLPRPEGKVVGNRICGRYLVLEEVGQGGMGRVLRAYDPKLQREVALKVLRTQALNAESQARLVVEARAMAKLTHPNVVAIYDVEDVDGSGEVVLVMEFVAGSDLRSWLRDQEHPWPEILALFVDAGRGLAAAHAAGILHRDFKPANVLVGASRGAKVTDFGLAKSQADTSTDTAESTGSGPGSPLLTQAGVVMGTPRYMAPEQHMGGDVTTRSDQYAFCVALWEGLVGRAPFCGDGILDHKLDGPPPWPRPGIPRRIVEAIRVGLDPNPGHRWLSLDALLEALSYDPVRRRNRVLLSVSAATVVAFGAMAWQSWSSARAQRCSGAAEQIADTWNDARRDEIEAAFVGGGLPYAETAWSKVAARLDGYAARWAEMHTEACEATSLRGEQSVAVMDLRMACLRRAELDMAAITEVLAEAGSDPQIIKKADQVVAGLAALEQCADVEALQADVEPPPADEKETVDAIQTLVTEMYAHSVAGRFDEGQRVLDRAKELVETVKYEPVRTVVALAEAELLGKHGKYEEAEQKYREALELAAACGQRNAQQRASQMLMDVVGDRLGRPEEGLRYLELARGLARGQPRRQATLYLTLSNVRRQQGKIAEAEDAVRRSLELEQIGDLDEARVARTRSSLAGVLYEQSKYNEAEKQMRVAIEEMERSLGTKHPDVGGARSNLGLLLHRQGKYDEAEAEHRLAVTQREDVLGRDHPLLLLTRGNLVDTLRELGKFEEAEAEAREVLALRLERYGPDHPEVAISLQSLGTLLKVQGRYEEAEVELARSVSLREKVLDPDHPYIASSYGSMGDILYLQERYDEAEHYYRKGLALQQKTLDADHRHLADSRFNLAITLYEQARMAEALPFAELAWERRKRPDLPPQSRAETAFLLARILWKSSSAAADRKRSLELARQARDTWDQLDDRGGDQRGALDVWLARRERADGSH